MPVYNIDRCPHCSSGTLILGQVTTEIEFHEGVPFQFGTDHPLGHVKPLVGGTAFCLVCDGPSWKIERLAGDPAYKSGSVPAEAIEKNTAAAFPPISIAQLDALRDLFRLGIAEAILTQGPGNRQFAVALANHVTYELISTLVAHHGPDLMAFGAGADPQFEPDNVGYNRVIGFASLLNLALNTNNHPTVDALDTHAEKFLGECYDAVSVVVAGITDALVANAPAALVAGLGIGQSAELRAAVAATVGGWGLAPGEEPPDGEIGEIGEPR